MKTHVAILAVGFYKKKNDRRNYNEVSQRSSHSFRQSAYCSSRARRRPHRASTAGTKGGIIWHFRSAVGAGNRHEF
jgi:hypothetical protein